jgi:hypothetical protein
LLALGLVLGGLVLLGGVSALALILASKADQPAADRASGSSQVASVPGSDTPAGSLPETSVPRRDLLPDEPPPEPPSYSPPPLGSPSPAKEEPKPREPKAPPLGEMERGGWLTKDAQLHVNQAIDQGVAFLQKKQHPTGPWGPAHRVGMAALPGLTLLECGVPGTDPAVLKVASFIRARADSLRDTYDLALAILFLDRLGDAADEKLIRTFALRLTAGQLPSGGWTYTCPILTPQDEKLLLTALQVTRPRSPLDLFVRTRDGKPPEWFVPVKMQAPSKGPEFTIPRSEKGSDVPGSTIPLGDNDPRDPGKLTRSPTREEVRKALDKLPAPLKNTPALLPIDKAHVVPAGDGTDNSNTHFAILGMWAATRHKVPVDRALALIVMRFRSSQNPDGTWAYHYHKGGVGAGTPAMTGAGLLGLAVGHGLAVGEGKVEHGHKADLKDRAIDHGFDALSNEIGKPFGLFKEWLRKGPKGKTHIVRRAPINLYFLWTVERVGVLYNKKQIGGKEWYSWGVEELLARQEDDGAWRAAGYHGATEITDTCFALLFLRRANLARDLSNKLEFVIQDRTGRP